MEAIHSVWGKPEIEPAESKNLASACFDRFSNDQGLITEESMNSQLKSQELSPNARANMEALRESIDTIGHSIGKEQKVVNVIANAKYPSIKIPHFYKVDVFAIGKEDI